MGIEYLCECGHVEEEHQSLGFFRPCDVPDCYCDDYEEAVA